MTYSISTDTANAALDMDSLIIEIGQAAITPAIDVVTASDDVLDITFKAALSGAEQTTLDGVVAAHQGISPEPEHAKVQISNVPTVAVDKGTHDFDTLISHEWTDNTTWPAVDDSLWMFEPSDPSKQIKMVKSEVQFSHNVQLGSQLTPGEFNFDIWVYNPLFDSGLSVDPDDETFVPGVSSGNPLRFLYKRTTFKSIKDVFNYGNDHYTMDAPVDGISTGITTVKFSYDQSIVLRGDQGAQVRFSMKSHNAMDGDYCTVSVVLREEDIPS